MNKRGGNEQYGNRGLAIIYGFIRGRTDGVRCIYIERCRWAIKGGLCLGMVHGMVRC